jgi:N-acyl-phosphatidylethanolamine-hydrolysing phospholipase D
VRPEVLRPRAGPETLAITWIGHSAVLMQIAGLNLLTDPMFGPRASPVPFAGPRRWVPPGIVLADVPPVDGVLLTHNHYDHLDAGSVRALARRHPEAAWIVPLRLGAFVRDLGPRVVVELDWWQQHSIGPLRITATPAQHFSSRHPFDRNRTLWCGYAVRGPRHGVLFAGDTGYHPEFGRVGREQGPFDLVMLPVGAYEPAWIMQPLHMNPEEAVRAYQDLNGRDGARAAVMMAVHWGTFKLTDEPMDEPPARVRAAWEAAGLASAALWVPVHGETRRIPGGIS